jgi:hypothetical protein
VWRRAASPAREIRRSGSGRRCHERSGRGRGTRDACAELRAEIIVSQTVPDGLLRAGGDTKRVRSSRRESRGSMRRRQLNACAGRQQDPAHGPRRAAPSARVESRARPCGGRNPPRTAVDIRAWGMRGNERQAPDAFRMR